MKKNFRQNSEAYMINASSIDGFDYVKEIKQHKFFMCQTDAGKSVKKPIVDRYTYNRSS